MERAGVQTLFSSSQMAVVGITEVFSRLRVIAKAYLSLRSILKSHRPDLLVLIDYPDFNLHLARAAKRFQVPVLYYISPQVWAWRPGRVKKLARRVDRMAVILPFEEEFYRKRGMEVEYVGHPLLDIVPRDLHKEEVLQAMGLADRAPILGLLPGSRRREVQHVWPTLVRAAHLVAERRLDAQFLVPIAPGLDRATFEPVVRRGWTAMVNAVQPDGMLGWVQRIGYEPGATTAETTEVYGVGAFLLAGTEMHRLAAVAKK
jgi:lipid-A-disaccharide synthase